MAVQYSWSGVRRQQHILGEARAGTPRNGPCTRRQEVWAFLRPKELLRNSFTLGSGVLRFMLQKVTLASLMKTVGGEGCGEWKERGHWLLQQFRRKAKAP